jgi:outer membrane receptor protein involved in Fe transport
LALAERNRFQEAYMKWVMRSSVQCWIILLVVFSFAATMALAQGIVTGTMSGTITDATGAIIPGAKITAIHVDTNSTFSAVSSDSGYFLLTKLPPGKYNVTVEAQNFRTVKVAGAEVSVARETQLSKLQMEIGGKAEIVEVSGAAPLIEPQATQISMTFSAQKVTDLPVGRGIDQLALFLPGVATGGSVSRGNNNGAVFSANGQRPRSNNFQIDGQGMNDQSVTGPAIFLENPDIVAEYQVMTNYDASYGRNLGSQVNIVTKSGTNGYHGTATETWRGSTFDSYLKQEKNPLLGFCTPQQNPSTDNCTDPKISRYVRNLFGGTFGGPILKDKAWFFGSALWDRVRTAGGSISDAQGRLTPTTNGLAQLAAAFPNSPGVGFLQRFGPAVLPGDPTFGSLTTRPVSDGVTTAQVEFGTPARNIASVSNVRQFTGRADWQLTSKDRLFGRYLIDDEISTNVDNGEGAWGITEDVPSRGQQLGVDWTHQFSNRFVNQARFNWTRLRVVFEKGTTGCTAETVTDCPISILTFTDATLLPMGLSGSFPQGRANNSYEWQDNANFAIGRHVFKFGGYWSRQYPDSFFLPNYNGAYGFASFDAFVRNTPNRFQMADGPFAIRYTENDLAFYFQDDIRLRQNLTVTVGLRWEYYQDTINKLHELSVERQAGSNPFWNTSLPLERTTIPAVPEDKNNFGPVIGVAWNMDQKTVFRGGFRLAYDPSFYNIHLNVASAAPVVNSATLNSGTLPGMPTSGFDGAASRQSGLPFIPTGGDPAINRTLSLVSPNFHNPYSEQWNFGVQRELTPNAVLELRYLGNHSVGLFQNLNANPGLNYYIARGFSSVIPQGLTPCADPTQPGFGPLAPTPLRGHADCARQNVNLRSNTGGSNYHALQSRFDIRAWHGATATMSYTWSHAIDNASDIFSTTGAGMLNVPQNPFDNGQGERSNSNFDYRHGIGLQLLYEVPWYKQQQGILGRVLGGWQTSVTYRYASGQPWTPIQNKTTGAGLCDTTNLLSTSVDACRPILGNTSAPFNFVGRITNIVGGVPVVTNLATNQPANLADMHWIINNDFAATYFGSPFLGVARNTETGQPTHATNLSMQKQFKLSERFGFQLRATAYNVLNHMFLGVPGNNVNLASSTFGNFTRAVSGGTNPNRLESGLERRRLEFGGKLIF